MSINTKQRFGEVLAVILIVGFVGLLVYLLLPSHTNTPKVSPVTVRSTTSVALQHHAVAPTYQTQPSTNEARVSAVAASSAPPSAAPVRHPTTVRPDSNHVINSKNSAKYTSER